MPEIRHVLITLFFCTVVLASLSAVDSSAHPVLGERWILEQPDGVLANVRIWGDEYYRIVESLDGYTLTRDPATSVICYARLSPDGNRLESTGARLNSIDPATLGLSRHVRVKPARREAVVAKARAASRSQIDRALSLRGLSLRDLSPPNVIGQVKGLCILIDFDDLPATIPRDDIDDLCNQPGYTGYGNNGSVRDYFYDVSNGKLEFTNWVSPVYYRALRPFVYYDDCNNRDLEGAEELVIEALDHMEATGFDFSEYDADGDGFIDAISVFYAGSTRCGWAGGLWPGSGWLGDVAWTADGVSPLRYQVTGIGNSIGIGVFVHECGHMVCGWPDLYDYDFDSWGIGRFCLMSIQSSNTNPIEPCGYLKYISGWADAVVLDTPQTGISVPSSSTNTVYKFDHPTLENEYFLIENRRQTERDTAIPDEGLAIWHIDTEGNNSNNQRTLERHFLVTLLQADGRWDLENDRNQGDRNDLWSAPTHTVCMPCWNPATRWWDSRSSGLTFANISEPAPVMTFDLAIGEKRPVAVCKPIRLAADEDECATVRVSDINNGSYDPDGAGDTETLCIFAVDGEPVGCHQEFTVRGIGSHSVTLRISDWCGRADVCIAPVEVVADETPPDIAVTLTPDVLWPPNHKLVDITATVAVTDDLDPNPTFELVSIEVEDMGRTATDAVKGAEFGAPDTEFLLRATRRGHGSGRTYTILYNASDASGNTSVATVSLRVPHDIADGLTDDLTNKNDDGEIAAVGGRESSGHFETDVRSAYPNPFNPSTRIEFTLAEAGPVSLAVYDVRGARIRSLVERVLPKGIHRVEWNGTDRRGGPVATGVYLLRFNAGDFTTTRKIVFLK